MDIPRQFPRRDCIFHYAFVKVHTAEDKTSLTLSSRPLSAVFCDKTYICSCSIGLSLYRRIKILSRPKIYYISSAISSPCVTSIIIRTARINPSLKAAMLPIPIFSQYVSSYKSSCDITTISIQESNTKFSLLPSVVYSKSLIL